MNTLRHLAGRFTPASIAAALCLSLMAAPATPQATAADAGSATTAANTPSTANTNTSDDNATAQHLESVTRARQASESPSIVIGDTSYASLKEALAASSDGDVIETKGAMTLSERLTLTTAKTVTVRAVADTTLTRPAGIHMVAMDTGTLKFEAADDAAFTFEGAAAASNFSAFYAAGAARIVLGRHVSIQNFKANNLAKGVVEINGGTIMFDGAVMTGCVGGATVAGGSSTLDITAGTVNTVTQNTSGTVRIGGQGKVEDRVTLSGNAKVTVTSALTAHTADEPLTLAAASLVKNRVVATFPDKALATASLPLVKAVTTAGDVTRLRVTNATLTVANVDELLDQIDNPFTDDLRTQLVDEFNTADKIAQAKNRVSALSGLSDDEKTAYVAKLDELDATRDYLERNSEAINRSIIDMSQLGDFNAEQRRNQQGYEFDNMDFSGFYVRPGTSVRFRVYVDAENPGQIALTYRQTGHMDTNSYLTVWVPDRARFASGMNEVTINATDRTVGLALFLRNYGTGKARVRIEALDASNEHPVTGTTLGQYPYYVYDAEHPEQFWTYVQEVREYAKTVDTVTNYVGDLPGRLDLNADMTGLMVGRSVFTTSATGAVKQLYSKINDEQSSIAYITAAYRHTEDRLAYFDHIMGFNADDPQAVHHPTKMRVVTESSQNLTSPSTMFAFTNLQSMPLDAEAALLDGTGPDGWGLDHEFGHCVDLGPLIIGEETNNLISLWGRVRAEKARIEKEGGEFSINTYHESIYKSSLPAYKQYLAKSAAGEDASMNWNDVFLAVMIRWQILRYFDNYDYDHDGLQHDRAIVEQIKTYGTLGTLYRLVRENPNRYDSVGTSRRDRMVAAFSEVTGFNMNEVFSRLGVTAGDAAKEFSSKYPSIDKPIEYYTTDADVKTFNGVTGYDTAKLPTPKVTAQRNANGGIDIKASMPDDASANSTVGWRLLADGKIAGYSDNGSFTVNPGAKIPVYSVIAYDVKLNASKTVSIANTVDLTLDVSMIVAGGDSGSKATATAVITPKSADLETRRVALKDGPMTVEAVPLSSVAIECSSCTASPASFEVDPFDWPGTSIPVTVVADDMTDLLGQTPKPTIRAAAFDSNGKETTAADGTMAFVIDVADGETVYYTTDGSEPSNTNGLRFAQGDTIPFAGATMTVKARAYRTGYRPSAVAQASWTATQKAAVYTQIWGPSYGSGNKLELLPGEYAGREQLGEHYENIRSVAVPKGYKVTLYGNPNTLSYTSNQDWLGNYQINQKIQRVKVEVLYVPAMNDTYTVKFAPGTVADTAENTPVTGTMAERVMQRGVTFMLPAVEYHATGYEFAGWKGSDGKTYSDGQSVTDLAAKGATVTLTTQWAESECVEGSPCVIDPYRTDNDPSKWTAPAAPEGKAFAGWYADAKLTRTIPKAMRSGHAYPRFVKAGTAFSFRGGSLRVNTANSGAEPDYSSTGMRFGYAVTPFSDTTVTAWGWRYGASADNLVGTAKGTAKVDREDGSFLTNLAILNFSARNYSRDVYSRLWIAYVTADGTPVTVQDEARSRSIAGIARSIVEDGSGASAEEITYARGILAQIGEE